MDIRSSFLLGKYVFIKIISLDKLIIDELKSSLRNGNYLPFETNEIIANYILSISKDSIHSGSNILTPNTRILVSKNKYDLSDMNKYRNETYEKTLEKLRENWTNFSPDSLNNISTVIILSEKVDGNLESFLRIYNPNKKEIEDALIHLSYLYSRFQKKYKMLHIDPKINNYTWKKLNTPIDLTYKFNDGRIIFRRNIKHLFYLTDLEFVYSPIIKAKKIDNQVYYFNFSKKYEWLRDDRPNLLIVPKISAVPYYDYNVNLFLGIEGFKDISKIGIFKDSQNSQTFPRMFTIDILVLVKMLLTFDYISYLPSSISRKLQRYFTEFCSISKKEEQFRYQVNYASISPSSFAHLFK